MRVQDISKISETIGSPIPQKTQKWGALNLPHCLLTFHMKVFSLYFFGVIPMWALNDLINILCVENPSEYAISIYGRSVFLSRSQAVDILTPVTKPLRPMPTSFENSFDRYEGSSPRYAARPLTDRSAFWF